jgi:hypothetical protein
MDDTLTAVAGILVGLVVLPAVLLIVAGPVLFVVAAVVGFCGGAALGALRAPDRWSRLVGAVLTVGVAGLGTLLVAAVVLGVAWSLGATHVAAVAGQIVGYAFWAVLVGFGVGLLMVVRDFRRDTA